MSVFEVPTMAVAQVAALASIKREPPDTPGPAPSHAPHMMGLEERILKLCGDNPKGITDEIISRDQPTVDAEKRMKALQKLLSQGKIDLLKHGSTLVYRLKATSSSPSKTKGFEREEQLVYQIIEDCGNKGIWIRDIRFKSNLLQTQINRILKNLERNKLIKSVKSVQASKHRVYMLHDMVPHESVTGGAWYSDQDFDSEFVEVLNRHCLEFLQRKAAKAQVTYTDPLSRQSASYASVQEVCRFITERGISKVRLTADNIKTILNTLLYDGRAEVTVTVGEGEGETQRLYRASPSLLQSAGFSRIPCGVCPIIDQCCDGGVVSPSSCDYLREWLNF